jgi:16S rRNA processing protein RimM
VLKTQGRIGEVAVELHSNVPDRLTASMRVFALAGDGTRRELKIDDVWPHQGRTVLKFSNVDSITEAEALVGCELQVPGVERAPLEAGWTYISDLVGCTVFDAKREIGKIEAVQFGAGEAPLLIVRTAKKKSGSKDTNAERAEQYEIPFAEVYLKRVDLDRKQVRMQLPDGMLEVNAPITEEEKREQQEQGKHTKPD